MAAWLQLAENNKQMDLSTCLQATEPIENLSEFL
jgi:hypothetical protein